MPCQSVTIATQLLSLPLFLHYWDAERYGVWLLLSAVPGYIAMADVGMVTAAGNRMTMAMGKGNRAEAVTVFQTAFVFMSAVCVTAAVIIIPIVLFAPFSALSTPDYRVALVALVLCVLLALFGGLTEAVFRATGRYATGQTLAQLIRLGEWLGGIAGLISRYVQCRSDRRPARSRRWASRLDVDRRRRNFVGQQTRSVGRVEDFDKAGSLFHALYRFECP